MLRARSLGKRSPLRPNVSDFICPLRLLTEHLRFFKRNVKYQEVRVKSHSWFEVFQTKSCDRKVLLLQAWRLDVSSTFSIRKTIRFSSRCLISTLSPVSRIRFGMSITDNGSVQWTSRKSPAFTDFSALRVFSAGSGHFKPVRSSFVVVMAWDIRFLKQACPC